MVSFQQQQAKICEVIKPSHGIGKDVLVALLTPPRLEGKAMYRKERMCPISNTANPLPREKQTNLRMHSFPGGDRHRKQLPVSVELFKDVAGTGVADLSVLDDLGEPLATGGRWTDRQTHACRVTYIVGEGEPDQKVLRSCRRAITIITK